MKPPRIDSKHMNIIAALFDTPRPTGLRLREMADMLPQIEANRLYSSALRMFATGRLQRCGVKQHYHYFLDAEQCVAAETAVADRHARERAEQADRRREQYVACKRNRREAEKAAGKPKPPKPPKAAPLLSQPKGRAVGVTLAPELALRANALTVSKKPLGSVTRATEIVIPDHVQIQRLPGYVCDTRWVVPNEPVIGGWASMGPGRYLEDRV